MSDQSIPTGVPTVEEVASFIAKHQRVHFEKYPDGGWSWRPRYAVQSQYPGLGWDALTQLYTDALDLLIAQDETTRSDGISTI